MSDFDSAALLAGGSSKRMGFDKQLLHFYADRLFKHIFPALTLRFSDIMVITGTPGLYEKHNVRTVPDIIPGLGPLSGIHAAIAHSKSEYVYVLACDMPVISMDYIDFMKDKLIENPSDACVTRKGDRIEPFHAFYSKRCLTTVEDDLIHNKSSVRYLLEKVDTLYIQETEALNFTPDWSLFCNLNTPEDYQKYRSASL